MIAGNEQTLLCKLLYAQKSSVDALLLNTGENWEAPVLVIPSSLRCIQKPSSLSTSRL